jgi:DNA-binding MarR family transcriptional regulator
MFFGLARVNQTLRAEIDRRLQATHELTVDGFDAMTAISEQSCVCEEGALAGNRGLASDDARGIVESLVSSGHVRRTRKPDGGEPAAVMLTLRGRLMLSRASRIVDESLAGTIGSALSRQELSRLENALAQLRRRPATGPLGRRSA